MTALQEGYIDYAGYKTYYKIVGELKDGMLPLVMLHGGPGSTHYYLEPYELMAQSYGRQLIFYDQIGCGHSSIPHQDDSFYSYELWEDELDVVREALGLGEIHLFGHSWGGMLAMMYTLRNDAGIKSLTVAASPANISTWLLEAKRLVGYLPQDMQDALWEAERTQHYDAPEAQAAYEEYYMRHVTGEYPPYSPCIQKSFDMTGECYMVMQGASEFVVTGKMRDFDVTADLPQLKVPTLLLSGTADEATPLVMKESFDRIPNCEWALISGGAHMGHVQYTKEYCEALENFLRKHE
ncbi:MAG: proline iminopeptidase-family hydrolase [Coriobacteriales bacterium]|nr:proline iminopeptidase-family hydrolase [Coriobacteriales bacterium]